MEEYEYKLSKRNPVLILNTIKCIIDKMRVYRNEGNLKDFELYYKFLKEKCLYGNNTVSTTITNGFISLSQDEQLDSQQENQIFSMKSIVNDLLASISHAKNLNGVINIVIHILTKTSDNNYGIVMNQHPLITILKINQNIWPILEPRIRNNITNSNFYGTLRPFFLYILYDHGFKVSENVQLQILSLLSPTDSSTIEIYQRVYSFSQEHINRTLHYLKARPKCHPELLANCIWKLLEYDMDPLDAICTLKTFYLSPISKADKYGGVVNMLANCIIIAPIIYLYELLDLCYYLLKFHVLEPYSLNLLKSAVTHWKMKFPVYDEQSAKADQTMNAILTFKGRKELEFLDLDFENDEDGFDENTFEYLCSFDKMVFISMSLKNIDLYKIKDDLLEVPPSVLNDIFNFLLSNLFKNKDDGFVLKALLRCVEAYPERSQEVMARILYELSNCDPHINLQLLKALPKMGVLKENLPVIVSTLKTISKTSPIMNMLCMSLYYDLWCVDARCYPYLQEMFVQDFKNDDFIITKAYILKELCEKRPELYGVELTTHLSKILNESIVDDGLSASFALEGITHLCKNDIIDMASAWNNLAPKFESENRTIVIKSLCEMISEIPNMSIESEKHEALLEEVLKILWDFTVTTSDIAVLNASYKALGAFTLEQISAYMPDIYITETLVNAFGYISGNCWLNVLLHGNRCGLNSAADMLISLISAEIKAYHKGIYEVREGSGEPPSMSNLPRYSIVHTLTNYIKNNVSKCESNDFEVYLQCLRILSEKYARPLPPMDWCFLQELLHVPEAREYCITLASRQVALSGTARRLMENYIQAYASTPEEIVNVLYVYKNLSSLCNSIQPMVMKPFIANTLNYIYHNMETDPLAIENIKIMIDNLILVLKMKSILEANKSVIAEEIVELFIKNNKYYGLIDCIVVLPNKYLDKISFPSEINDLTIKEATMCIEIRTLVAYNCEENPFIYLNALADLKCFQQNEDLYSVKCSRLYIHLFENLIKVFTKHRNNELCVGWLMELMGRIQMMLADNKKMEQVEVKCFIFMIAVSVLSGYYIFEESHDFYCFPQALPHLLLDQRFKPYTSQILEWLYDISNNSNYKISRPHQNDIKKIFVNALLALRDEPTFNNNHKWMKYIEIKHNLI